MDAVCLLAEASGGSMDDPGLTAQAISQRVDQLNETVIRNAARSINNFLDQRLGADWRPHGYTMLTKSPPPIDCQSEGGVRLRVWKKFTKSDWPQERSLFCDAVARSVWLVIEPTSHELWAAHWRYDRPVDFDFGMPSASDPGAPVDLESIAPLVFRRAEGRVERIELAVLAPLIRDQIGSAREIKDRRNTIARAMSELAPVIAGGEIASFAIFGGKRMAIHADNWLDAHFCSPAALGPIFKRADGEGVTPIAATNGAEFGRIVLNNAAFQQWRRTLPSPPVIDGAEQGAGDEPADPNMQLLPGDSNTSTSETVEQPSGRSERDQAISDTAMAIIEICGRDNRAWQISARDMTSMIRAKLIWGNWDEVYSIAKARRDDVNWRGRGRSPAGVESADLMTINRELGVNPDRFFLGEKCSDNS